MRLIILQDDDPGLFILSEIGLFHFAQSIRVHRFGFRCVWLKSTIKSGSNSPKDLCFFLCVFFNFLWNLMQCVGVRQWMLEHFLRMDFLDQMVNVWLEIDGESGLFEAFNGRDDSSRLRWGFSNFWVNDSYKIYHVFHLGDSNSIQLLSIRLTTSNCRLLIGLGYSIQLLSIRLTPSNCRLGILINVWNRTTGTQFC